MRDWSLRIAKLIRLGLLVYGGVLVVKGTVRQMWRPQRMHRI